MIIPIVLALSVLGPYSSSSNFSANLFGSLDTRDGCWGFAEATEWPITFKPPAGYRVRILSPRGDLVAWPQVLPGEPAAGRGRYAGVLLGFRTTDPEGSIRCDYCADNTMLYVQAALDDRPTRASFHDDVTVGGLLGADHRLMVKVSAWLNTIERPIHVEPTFTVTYHFEPE